jgi:hypothetical protein
LLNSVQVYEVQDFHGKTRTLQSCFEFLSTSITITVPMLQVHRIFIPMTEIMYESFLLLATSLLVFQPESLIVNRTMKEKERRKKLYNLCQMTLIHLRKALVLLLSNPSEHEARHSACALGFTRPHSLLI